MRYTKEATAAKRGRRFPGTFSYFQNGVVERKKEKQIYFKNDTTNTVNTILFLVSTGKSKRRKVMEDTKLNFQFFCGPTSLANSSLSYRH